MGAKPLPGLSRVAVSEGFVEARRLLEPLKQSHGVREGSLGGGSALASAPESSPRTQGCTAPPSTLRLSEQPTWPNPGVSHSHLTSITAMRRGQEREGHSCPSPEPPGARSVLSQRPEEPCPPAWAPPCRQSLSESADLPSAGAQPQGAGFSWRAQHPLGLGPG